MTEESIHVEQGRECNKIKPDGSVCGQGLKSQMVRDVYQFGGYRRVCKEHMSEQNRRKRGRYAAQTWEEVQAVRLRLYPSGSKPCPWCQEWKPLSAYRKDCTEPSWLHNKCHDCELNHRMLRPLATARMLSLGISTHSCIYCGALGKTTLEHLFTGPEGFWVVENLVFACASDNSSKRNNENVHDWLAWFKPKNPHPLLGWLIEQAELKLLPPS